MLRKDLNELVSTVRDDTSNLLTSIDSKLNSTTASDDDDIEEEEENEHGGEWDNDNNNNTNDTTIEDDVHNDTSGETNNTLTMNDAGELVASDDSYSFSPAVQSDDFGTTPPIGTEDDDAVTKNIGNNEAVEEGEEAAQDDDDDDEPLMLKNVNPTISKVTNFFGDAMKNVITSVLQQDEDDYNTNKDTQFFGNNNDNEEEEDEEEQLGWDDDDEDEDDIDDDNKAEMNDSKNIEEQIEFNDEVLEQTKEELKLALVERDQLHETIKLLRHEIVTLHDNAKTNQPVSTDDNDIMVQLKLFEKVSELEAMKQKLMDNDDSGDKSNTIVQQQQEFYEDKMKTLLEQTARQDNEITRLQNELKLKQDNDNDMIATLKNEIELLKRQAMEATSSQKQDDDAEMIELKTIIEQQKNDILSLQEQINNNNTSSLDHETHILELKSKDDYIQELENELLQYTRNNATAASTNPVMMDTTCNENNNNDNTTGVSCDGTHSSSGSSEKPDTVVTTTSSISSLVHVEKQEKNSTATDSTPNTNSQNNNNDDTTTVLPEITNAATASSLLATKIAMEDDDNNSDWGDDW